MIRHVRPAPISLADSEGNVSYDNPHSFPDDQDFRPIIVYACAETPPPPADRRPKRKVLIPLLLFITTCVSTFLVGGPAFCLALMTTLGAHELGHFIQAWRYGVPASFPFFIPMPFNLVGTMGAVIAMQPRSGDRKALFDIGITGPLAGLVPAIVFCLIGLWFSEVKPIPQGQATLMLGEPLVFKLMAYLVFGPLPEGQDIILHPIAYAGWVGIFITALNLIPIGQLDGGHILYALLRTRAHAVAKSFLIGAILLVVVYGYWAWSLMILLLLLMGPVHPPTANDNVQMGRGRIILGWLTLLFIFVGFTPTPFFVEF